MTLHAEIQIGSPTVIAVGSMFESIRVAKSVSHESDKFTASLYNVGGVRSGLFTVGDEVKIYHDTGSPATNNQIFLGRIESIDFEAKANKEIIKIGGRNYASALMDVKVQAVYLSGTNNVCEIGSIVRDVIWNSPFSGTIDTSLVSGVGTVLNVFSAKNKTVYEAVKELARIAEYDFYVDVNKKLVFAPENADFSGYTLFSGNATAVGVETNTKEMYNIVTVYGDRQIIRDQQTFTADGAGSVFTLIAKPHDTYLTVDGTKKKGGVFELVSFLPTGTQYLVDYDNKQIVFISGTDVGDNIPGSLATVTVQFGKSVPIVKEATDEASIAAYGVKENVITNSEIKDPREAREIALAELARTRNPAVEARLKIQDGGIASIQPGNTVTVDVPHHNINTETMKAFQVQYDITQDNLLKDKTVSVFCGNRIQSASDVLMEIIRKQRAIQAQQADTSDLITKIKTAKGELVLDYKWIAKSRAIESEFILGTSKLGTGQLGQTFGDYATFDSGGNFSI